MTSAEEFTLIRGDRDPGPLRRAVLMRREHIWRRILLGDGSAPRRLLLRSAMTMGAVGIVFGMLTLLLLAAGANPPPVGWVVSRVGMPSVLAILFAVRALLGSPTGPRVIVTFAG